MSGFWGVVKIVKMSLSTKGVPQVNVLRHA